MNRGRDSGAPDSPQLVVVHLNAGGCQGVLPLLLCELRHRCQDLRQTHTQHMQQLFATMPHQMLLPLRKEASAFAQLDDIALTVLVPLLVLQ